MNDTNGQKIAIPATVKAGMDHQRYYDLLTQKITKLSNRFPRMRNIDVISIIGRILGILIAGAPPDQRDAVRAVAIKNIDGGIAIISSLSESKKTPNQKPQEQRHAVNNTTEKNS